MASKRDKPIDWQGIERDFIAGVMSVREMARWYGVDEKAIRKKAQQSGWIRKQAAPHLRADRARPIEPSEIIPPASENPEALADRGRTIATRLMDELESVTAHIGEIEDMICAEESDPRRRQALLKAVSLGERTQTLKNLSAAVKTLNETAAPAGKKAQRQASAERAAGSGGKYAPPPPPRLVVDNH
ncbi:hypothetical protein GCM10008171_32820 [Methylopila jiangsuensis]|uniref:Terminase small subunit n=1 Tax=Methylopila jiangsuensis TaxID=586230 RepID=A0A9W6N558_9HYPH|nr:hypothetical protein [Methylopila jiangsuensis]MDR6284583.1 hypothetical protein [Methylopila jiangsuensis]GLK78028.1 hypothetical protein GCM10008171_32820 [Methylopila jiangsuensis]